MSAEPEIKTLVAPDPDIVHPIEGQPRVVLLKNVITSPLITVGDFSYYDDPDSPESFQHRNVLHHYGPDRLIIGKYCAFASGTTFLMGGANHRHDGVSTFPFPIMGGAWKEQMHLLQGLPTRGDTTVGHDVWLGHDVLVMPGVSIGSGAIVAAGAVVSANVQPYAVVAGNPAREVKLRFSPLEVARLLAIAWWDWPTDHLTACLPALMSGDVAALERLRPSEYPSEP